LGADATVAYKRRPATSIGSLLPAR
jgi:hypothetical protein